MKIINEENKYNIEKINKYDIIHNVTVNPSYPGSTPSGHLSKSV